MYTYDVISESVRNPHQLASELTRRSQEGWEVVEIVFDGAAWFRTTVTLDAAQARHKVQWRWIKGHAGHAENERADALARAGMAPFKVAKA